VEQLPGGLLVLLYRVHRYGLPNGLQSVVRVPLRLGIPRMGVSIRPVRIARCRNARLWKHPCSKIKRIHGRL
jgi:hypothetical protein